MKNFKLIGIIAFVIVIGFSQVQIVSSQTNNAQAHRNRGMEYLNNGDYDRAITEFSQAIRINANDADAHFNRGVAYYL